MKAFGLLKFPPQAPLLEAHIVTFVSSYLSLNPLPLAKKLVENLLNKMKCIFVDSHAYFSNIRTQCMIMNKAWLNEIIYKLIPEL